jgi:hypothetical protein
MVMTYSDKVKAASIIINAINGLKDKESIRVAYGTDYNNVPVVYKISCSIFRDGKPSLSIYKDDVWAMSGMNVESINKTTMVTYTYDMMSQRTSYRFPLHLMTLIQD